MDPKTTLEELALDIASFVECCVCTEPCELVLFDCMEHGVCGPCFHSMLNTSRRRYFESSDDYQLDTIISCPLCKAGTSFDEAALDPLLFHTPCTMRFVELIAGKIRTSLGQPHPPKEFNCTLCKTSFPNRNDLLVHMQQCVGFQHSCYYDLERCNRPAVREQPYCEHHGREAEARRVAMTTAVLLPNTRELDVAARLEAHYDTQTTDAAEAATRNIVAALVHSYPQPGAVYVRNEEMVVFPMVVHPPPSPETQEMLRLFASLHCQGSVTQTAWNFAIACLPTSLWVRQVTPVFTDPVRRDGVWRYW